LSFKHSAYVELLQSLRMAARFPITVGGYVENNDQDKQARYVVLRHDVDRMPSRAIAMAEIEASSGVRATYYFRCSKSGRFPDSAIHAIADMGHEIGYHYECLSACRGDRSSALINFERNLDALRKLAPCKTVAMHGAPLSPFSNQDLLLGIDLSRFALVCDASLWFLETPVAYFTDTGGIWNADEVSNFRDRVGRAVGKYPSPSSIDFAQWLSGFRELVYVSTHPERWTSTAIQYGISFGMDQAVNLAKRAIRHSRRSR